MISSSSPNFEQWWRAALENERWFSSDLPKWPNLPTNAWANAERNRRGALLLRSGHHSAAEALLNCAPHHRCGSGACPECARAAQRYLVRKAYRELTRASEIRIISAIPPHQFRVGELDRLSLGEYRNLISQSLRHCRINNAICGIDFSLNEDQIGQIAPHWSPHIWLFTSSFNRARWEMGLREHFRKTPTILRPVVIKQWDGSRRALGYLLKNQFNRRISKLSINLYRGGSRQCRNTTSDRLRSSERVELYSFLHSAGLSTRILIFGFGDR